MEELIERENVAVHVTAADWKDAIQKAGELLVNSGKISRQYIDEMILSVEKMGPYIVLAPKFALAHAAPSEAVMQTSAPIITLESPVRFGSPNDPVEVVLCLACIDRTSHINELKKVAGQLMKDGMLDRMCRCESNEQLYELING